MTDWPLLQVPAGPTDGELEADRDAAHAAAVAAWVRRNCGLVHYSDTPVRLDRSRRYPQSDREITHGKPYGLWVSVPGDDDWPSWCAREDYAIDRLATAHQVTLRSRAEVLQIRDVTSFDRFAEEFSIDDPGPFARAELVIDWVEVAGHYDGIVIAPYRWDRRSEHRWYWGWDVASGCIWNLDAIDEFEAI